MKPVNAQNATRGAAVTRILFAAASFLGKPVPGLCVYIVTTGSEVEAFMCAYHTTLWKYFIISLAFVMFM